MIRAVEFCRRLFVRPRLPSIPVLFEAGVLTLAAVCFVLLGREYGAPLLVAVDAAGLAFLRGLSTPWLDSVVAGVTRLGAEALWFIWVPIALVLLARRRVPSALALVVVAVGVYPFNDLLKSLYQRARPEVLEGVTGVQVFSFPSGHAMAAGAVFGMLCVLAWRELSGARRRGATCVCLLAALAVAASRVYLAAHYPTDVLAGLLAGALWAEVVLLAWRLAAEVTRRSASVSSPQRAHRRL